jgi:hypothetical protein
MRSINSDGISGRSFLSVPGSFPSRPGVAVEGASLPSILGTPKSERQAYATELDGLLSAVGVVSRRTLANRLLLDWTIWLSWILSGLFLAAAFSSRLRVAVIAAAVLLVTGGLVSVVRNWRMRLSAYDAARQLDSAGGFYDRFSTALHFGAVEEPGGMVLCQRRDALERLAQVDPRALFPIRTPRAARRTLLLAVAVAGIFTYRMHYSAPLTALLQRASRAHLEQAILSPFERAKDLLKRLAPEALVDALRGEKQPPDPSQVQSVDDFSPRLERGGAAQDAAHLGDLQQEDSGEQLEDSSASQGQNAQGGGTPSGGSRQAAAGGPSPENGHSSDEANKSDADHAGDNQPDSESAQQSLAQKMMQSLRNLMNDMMGRQPSESSQSSSERSSEGSQSQAQGGSPGGNSPNQPSQPNGSSGDGPRPRMDPRAGGASAQDGTQNAGSGSGDESNGSRPGSQQSGQNRPLPAGNMTPDRVTLDTTDFRMQSRERTSAGPGNAQVPLRNVSPQPVAAVKGAEQENIPLRYRLYVKRYFEHTTKTER